MNPKKAALLKSGMKNKENVHKVGPKNDTVKSEIVTYLKSVSLKCYNMLTK